MSEKSREQISALMDGEQETGSIFILSAMSNNEEFRQTWNRYHLIGEVLRGNLAENFDPGFVSRVSQAIENDAAYHASAGNRKLLFLKPLAGLAIAASVAAVAVLGVRQVGVTPGSDSSPELVANNQSPGTTAVQKRRAVPVSDTPAMIRPDQIRSPVDAESRLNRYLVNYNEYRTNAGVQGMLPYVRIVAHEVEE